MKPRGKRTSKKSASFLEVSQVTSKGTSPKEKIASKVSAGEAVQCEMGSEVFRRYWTPSSEGIVGDEAKQLITGHTIEAEPPRYISVDEEGDCNAVDMVDQATIEAGDKVDANACSNWSTVFPSHGITLEKGPNGGTALCKDGSGLVLTNNGADSGAMVFPLVLNVVDESGTKEVVAMVSLDMPPSNLTEHEEVLSESANGNAQPGTQTLTCGDCGQVFGAIVPFEKHCLEHNSTDPFKCTRCTRRFKRRQDLDRHRRCHPEEAFSCSTCFAKFSEQEELTSHYKTHAPAPLSPKSSEEPDAIEMLCKIETFPCSQCDKTFDDADLLQHHEFTHSEGELYPCDECGRTFREESRLATHLKLHKKNQKCDKCDEIFTNMFDFNEHMIAHKYEDLKEDYKCLHCKVSFNSFHFLKKHVSSHGMEVHWCGDCGGSGHVDSSPGESIAADANCNSETQVLVISKAVSLSKAEDDPLRLEDRASDRAVDILLQEQLVDDVAIKHENNSFSEEEAEILQSNKVEEKIGRGKRKITAHRNEAFHQRSLEPQNKSARNK